MTANDDTRDEELLARYRRASEDAAGPSDAVRAAILAESRRVAAELARQAPPPTFDVSRPAANDSRWKIPAFGTIGAALLAALIFAPRYWENAPPAQVSMAPAAAPAPAPAAAPAPAPAAAPVPAPTSAAAQAQDKAEAPKLEEAKPSAPRSSTEPARQAPSASDSLQEVVVTQAQRKSSKTAGPLSSNVASLAAAPPPNETQSYTAGSATRAERADSALMPATLQSAAAQGDVAQATSLLDQGAVIDARDKAGRTPLMLAVTQGQLEVVRLLLARGADPNAADNAGHTPLQQARQQNSREIAALLEGWQRARSAR